MEELDLAPVHAREAAHAQVTITSSGHATLGLVQLQLAGAHGAAGVGVLQRVAEVDRPESDCAGMEMHVLEPLHNFVTVMNSHVQV